MKILHLSPYVPSTKAGHAGGVCMGKEVEELSLHHEVYILSFVNNMAEKTLAKEYEGRGTFVKSTTLSKIINTIIHFYKPNLFGIRTSFVFTYRLIRLIKKHNIECIHAEYTSMGQYVWIKKIFPNIKFNLVEHDITIQSFSRLSENAKGIKKVYLLSQLKLVNIYEKKYCKKADHIFTLNKKDVDLLERHYQIKNNVDVIIPYYGIDHFAFHPEKKEKGTLCFIGQMAREENHIAAMRLIKIFQKINNQNWKLYIIGAQPSQELLSKSSDNIVITGFVDDINEYIDRCELGVFPLEIGAGIKLKVLLAFGNGLPVITTDVGAEGIDPDGNVLLLAKDDNDFMKYIKMLMSDEELLKKRADMSVKFVSDNFDWKKTEKLFQEIYRG